MESRDYANIKILSSSKESQADIHFIQDPPPQELICLLCSQVVRDPFQTQCCGNIFCGPCLQLHVKAARPCPVCHSRIKAFRDAVSARRVNALDVRCMQEALGCMWTGVLGELCEHLAECPNSSAECSLCGDCFQRCHLADHVSTQCRKRLYQCPHCLTFQSTYETVQDVHWAKCSEFPIACPNECSIGNIPRSMIFQHLKEECSLKREVKEMASVIRKMQKQLNSRDLMIEQLESQISEKEGWKKKMTKKRSASLCDDLMTEIEAVRCNNQELIQRITEVQMENAELKHQISLLQDYLKTEKGNVKQLECEKESFRVNVNTMSHDLVVQLKLLKLVQKEKEELEKEKTELQGRLQFHEKFENNEFSSIL